MWSWFHKHNWSSGNRAMCARPVQGVSSHYSSIQTLELERTATRTCTAGCFQPHSWDPACAPAPPETGGSRSQQAAHSTHGSLTGLFIFSHVVFYSKSPWHDTWRSTHLDLVSNAPSDQGLAAQWCPLRSFSRAALREGEEEISAFKAPSQSTTLLPSEGSKKGLCPSHLNTEALRLSRLPGKLVSTGIRREVDPMKRREEAPILKLLPPKSS